MNQCNVHGEALHWKNEDGNEQEMYDDEVFNQPDNVAGHEIKQVGASDVTDNNMLNDDDDDDDDESSDDENAHIKQIRPGQSSSNSSIRRNDSYTSFLTRSERSAMLGKDAPPTVQDAAKRRIRFRETLVDIIEFDKVDKNVKNDYWMTDDDFDRIETDIRMTQFRYENAKMGKIPFDDVNNSIRGLESVLNGIDLKMYTHRQSVLQEILEQKSTHGHVTDWEKVRHTSEVHSNHCRTKAVEVGKQDEIEHKKAWDTISGTTRTLSASKLIAKVKKTTNDVSEMESKKKNPLLFWKKR